MGRRVLVTGLATFWGGRVAQALEADPDVDVIVGLDTREPTVRLERTEYVRTDESYSIMARLVRATGVDTVLHTFMVVDSGASEARRMHEINVIGTMNLCAAVSAPGSTVRTVVMKSSSLVYGSSNLDPNVFAETTARSLPPATRLERSLCEAEQYMADLAADNPSIDVATLRFSNVLGPDMTTTVTRLLQLPAVPTLFGYDPQLQFVHEDDVARALRFAAERGLRGAYNVAGDGRIPWSELVARTGKPRLQILHTLAPMASRLLRATGAPGLTPELLDLLRFGRGIDNRKLKAQGFTYLFDTMGAVADHMESMHLRRAIGTADPGYRFQADVEDFFRRSPAVLRER
ncbi:MAG TPA: NAD-dependent epimerase/dehydratase family protein [Acidimicrobiales bacterium]